MAINQSTAFRTEKLKVVGVTWGEINSSSLSSKTVFVKYNRHIQEHICYVFHTHMVSFISRTDPRNVLPRKEELLRFMEENDS